MVWWGGGSFSLKPAGIVPSLMLGVVTVCPGMAHEGVGSNVTSQAQNVLEKCFPSLLRFLWRLLACPGRGGSGVLELELWMVLWANRLEHQPGFAVGTMKHFSPPTLPI